MDTFETWAWEHANQQLITLACQHIYSDNIRVNIAWLSQDQNSGKQKKEADRHDKGRGQGKGQGEDDDHVDQDTANADADADTGEDSENGNSAPASTSARYDRNAATLRKVCKQLCVTPFVLCFLLGADIVNSKSAVQAIRNLLRSVPTSKTTTATTFDTKSQVSTQIHTPPTATSIARRLRRQILDHSRTRPARAPLSVLSHFRAAIREFIPGQPSPDLWPVTRGTRRDAERKAVKKHQAAQADVNATKDDKITATSDRGEQGRREAHDEEELEDDQGHSEAQQARNRPPTSIPSAASATAPTTTMARGRNLLSRRNQGRKPRLTRAAFKHGSCATDMKSSESRAESSSGESESASDVSTQSLDQAQAKAAQQIEVDKSDDNGQTIMDTEQNRDIVEHGAFTASSLADCVSPSSSKAALHEDTCTSDPESSGLPLHDLNMNLDGGLGHEPSQSPERGRRIRVSLPGLAQSTGPAESRISPFDDLLEHRSGGSSSSSPLAPHYSEYIDLSCDLDCGLDQMSGLPSGPRDHRSERAHVHAKGKTADAAKALVTLKLQDKQDASPAFSPYLHSSLSDEIPSVSVDRGNDDAAPASDFRPVRFHRPALGPARTKRKRGDDEDDGHDSDGRYSGHGSFSFSGGNSSSKGEGGASETSPTLVSASTPPWTGLFKREPVFGHANVHPILPKAVQFPLSEDTAAHLSSALKENQQLNSCHITAYLSLLLGANDPAGNSKPRSLLNCQVFDPGFPFLTHSQGRLGNISHPERLPSHLLFIFHKSAHWTVGHLDRTTAILHHYDSMSAATKGAATEWVRGEIERAKANFSTAQDTSATCQLLSEIRVCRQEVCVQTASKILLFSCFFLLFLCST